MPVHNPNLVSLTDPVDSADDISVRVQTDDTMDALESAQDVAAQ